MSNWTLPGGLKHFEKWVDFFAKMPESIKESLGEVTVYDSYPRLLWNGGRFMPKADYSLDEAIGRVKLLNKMGIGFNFTMSNLLLEEAHLDDPDCNRLLAECEDEMNGVVVGTDLLRGYIREKYPKYKVIASTCQQSHEGLMQHLAKELKYDRVVLNIDLSQDEDVLSEVNPEKAVVILNSGCRKNCSMRRKHYERTSRWILEGADETDQCIPEKKTGGKGTIEYTCQVTEETFPIYHKYGIKNFKLAGRYEDFKFAVRELGYYCSKITGNKEVDNYARKFN